MTQEDYSQDEKNQAIERFELYAISIRFFRVMGKIRIASLGLIHKIKISHNVLAASRHKKRIK